MELGGKAAIVTGGGTGVGRATALELARQGCSVLINYSRSQTEAEATGAELEQLGVKAVVIKADVADDAACREMVATAEAAFGRLDLLVNNAGTTTFIPLDDLDSVKAEHWERIVSVNLQGPFQCARAARALLKASGSGQVINVSSIAGIYGVGSSIPYACSKGGLNTLTMILARVLGPEIRVNAVAPGFITGRWLEQGLGDRYESSRRAYSRRLPLGKVCDPEDVAAAIMSLVTGSQLITGQTLIVDGGQGVMLR